MGTSKYKISFMDEYADAQCPSGITQETVKDFYRRMLLKQEKEKKRISRDLHDEGGQMVVALAVGLNIIEKEIKAGNIEKALEEIERGRRIIQDVAGKMKSLALSLRPPALDILGLAAVLREYFSQCTKFNPFKIEFNENTKGRKLNENIEIALYRIAQEAIVNILKHSNADLVKVDLILSAGKVQLVIKDNGKGFDVQQYKRQCDVTKMGLRGINERVAIFDGKFNIVSVPGSGTELTVIFQEKEGSDFNI